MRKPDFSEIVAIVAKGERSKSRFLWELGDALLRAIGKPSTAGENDGSFAKLESCSEELAENGYEYETLTLKNLRFAAWRFPPESRNSGIPWHAHYLAQTPEMLQAIIAGAPRNQKIGVSYVQKVMGALALQRQRELDAETERRREVYETAKREREEAEAEQTRAKTAQERKAAADRAAAAAERQRRHVSPPTRKDIPTRKPKPEDIPILLSRVSFARDLGQITKGLRKLRETYEPLIPAFTQADLENGHEELMKIAERARSFADALQRRVEGRGSHLSIASNND